jgi:hypothetical protein
VGSLGSALTPDGRFAFETRNPLARAWEAWTPDHAVEVVSAAGTVVRMAHEVDTPADGERGESGETVSFTSTFTSPGWEIITIARRG